MFASGKGASGEVHRVNWRPANDAALIPAALKLFTAEGKKSEFMT